MLTREQKEKLRHLSYSQFFLTEQNGVPLDIRNHQPVKIPDFSELQEIPHPDYTLLYRHSLRKIEVLVLWNNHHKLGSMIDLIREEPDTE